MLDGNEVIIICNHTVVDPKYTTKCDMFTNPPIICVGHELNEVLEVKNVGKNAIVFQI